jgi:hypothetical protein
MFYGIQGQPDNLNISLVERALNHAMNAFEFRDNLIVIDFEEEFEHGQCGFADYDGDEYIVYLNPELNEEQFLRTLFHELCHIHQYISGRLVHDGMNSIWDGVLYTCEYSKLPWEIDAYKWEDKLFGEFNDEYR